MVINIFQFSNYLFFECIMQAIVNGLEVEYLDLKVGVILNHSKM